MPRRSPGHRVNPAADVLVFHLGDQFAFEIFINGNRFWLERGGHDSDRLPQKLPPDKASTSSTHDPLTHDPMPPPLSNQYLLHQMPVDISEPKIAPLIAEGQFRVVEP